MHTWQLWVTTIRLCCHSESDRHRGEGKRSLWLIPDPQRGHGDFSKHSVQSSTQWSRLCNILSGLTDVPSILSIFAWTLPCHLFSMDIFKVEKVRLIKMYPSCLWLRVWSTTPRSWSVEAGMTSGLWLTHSTSPGKVSLNDTTAARPFRGGERWGGCCESRVRIKQVQVEMLWHRLIVQNKSRRAAASSANTLLGPLCVCVRDYACLCILVYSSLLFRYASFLHL